MTELVKYVNVEAESDISFRWCGCGYVPKSQVIGKLPVVAASQMQAPPVPV